MKDPDLHQLRNKLCRELAQAELSAALHPAREASRLGKGPAAAAFRAVAAHAAYLRPQLDELLLAKQPVGARLGHLVGMMFSNARHFAFDRVMAPERSYRATLLGIKHGIDAARLLRDVTRRTGEIKLERFCDDLVAEREVLLREAERALSWFAERACAPAHERAPALAPAQQ